MKKTKSVGTIFVWILLGLLILGLAGLGVSGLGGTIRSIGSVGDQPILANDYARALQEDLRAIEAQTGQRLSFAEAQQFGVDRGTLERLVGAAALDHETTVAGISIGDENLARELTAIAAFQGPDGRFNRDAYSFALQQAGYTEPDFETRVRADSARSLMQAAIAGGVAMPDAYADALVAYAGARRVFEHARLTPEDLPAPLPVATEAELRTWFLERRDRFQEPAKKRITYVWLTPEMLVDTVEVDEASLRAAYDARAAEFNRPERRLVERLAFGTATDAETAKIEIEADRRQFDDYVTDRGLTLDDVDMGDVGRQGLGAAADAVFAADAGQVVGPFDSPIGPALFRMNGVLASEAISFEDALPELREEFALDRARRQIELDTQGIDDLMAGGATLDEVAAETAMELSTIDWFLDESEGIAAYPAFNAAAAEVAIGDFPRLLPLDDGGFVALRLDAEIPARPQEYDQVADRVLAIWESDRTEAALTAYAETLAPRLLEGTTFAGLGLTATREDGATRSAAILGTPPDFMTRVFAMQPGEVAVVTAFEAATMVRLIDDLAPDLNDPAIAALRTQIAGQADAGLQQDVFGAFAVDIQRRAGVRLDQAAINAVNANQQ